MPSAPAGPLLDRRPLQPTRGRAEPRDRHAAGHRRRRRRRGGGLVLPRAAHGDGGAGGGEHRLPRDDAAAAPARPPEAEGRRLVLDGRGGERLVDPVPRLLRAGRRAAGAPAPRPRARRDADELQGVRLDAAQARRDGARHVVQRHQVHGGLGGVGPDRDGGADEDGQLRRPAGGVDRRLADGGGRLDGIDRQEAAAHPRRRHRPRREGARLAPARPPALPAPSRPPPAASPILTLARRPTAHRR